MFCVSEEQEWSLMRTQMGFLNNCVCMGRNNQSNKLTKSFLYEDIKPVRILLSFFWKTVHALLKHSNKHEEKFQKQKYPGFWTEISVEKIIKQKLTKQLMEVQAPLHSSSLLHDPIFPHISSSLPSHRARTAATRGQVFIALLTAIAHLSCCSVRNEPAWRQIRNQSKHELRIYTTFMCSSQIGAFKI